MGDVIELPVLTTLDIPAVRLRDNIPWEEVDTGVVITLNEEGDMDLYCNKADMREVLYMCQKVAHKILNGDYG